MRVPLGHYFDLVGLEGRLGGGGAAECRERAAESLQRQEDEATEMDREAGEHRPGDRGAAGASAGDAGLGRGRLDILRERATRHRDREHRQDRFLGQEPSLEILVDPGRGQDPQPHGLGMAATKPNPV